MIKRFDRLSIGLAIILLTILGVAFLTLYEETTGNRIGYYALGFLPLMGLGMIVTATAFTKGDKNDGNK